MLRSLAKGLVRSLSGVVSPLERDGLTLDAELAVICGADNWTPRLHDVDPAVSRSRYLRSCRLAGPSRIELFGVEDGERRRIYRPSPDADRGLLYFHGGGFCIVSNETHDTICRRLARDTGRVVISGDYRLAPEHPFPAAVEDAVKHWEACQELGLRSIAVGGDSAGGNLAAVVAQRVEGVERTLLIYPGLDMARRYASMDLFGTGLLLSEELKKWFIDHYTQGTSLEDPALSPVVGQLAGQPPAHIVVAGFDILRDDGLAYAAALQDAGAEVEVVRFDSLTHGFLNVAGLSRASDAALTATAALIAIDSAHG